MKRNRSLSLLLLCSTVLLASCSQTDLRTPAPVEAKTSADLAAASAANAVVGPGYRKVQAGDTLYRIALESGQPYQNIVQWNHLANPNDIKVGQVLRVAPPSDDVAGSNSVAAIEPVHADNTLQVTPIESSTVGPQTDAKNVDGPLGNKQPYSQEKLAQMQNKSSTETTPPIAPVPVPAATTDSSTAKADAKTGWIWPTKGKITTAYTVDNKGIDIAGSMGQSIVAASSGKVMYAGSGIRGYGNLIIIKHDNNLLSAYAHNSKILVKEGQDVKQGEKIAEMGNTDATSVKLHFEIRQQGKPVDPTPYLPHQ